MNEEQIKKRAKEIVEWIRNENRNIVKTDDIPKEYYLKTINDFKIIMEVTRILQNDLLQS